MFSCQSVYFGKIVSDNKYNKYVFSFDNFRLFIAVAAEERVSLYYMRCLRIVPCDERDVSVPAHGTAANNHLKNKTDPL